MHRARTLRFDDLEARKLMASVHAAVVHPGPALILDGTLKVNTASSSSTQNGDGSWTTTIPVSGQLGDVGKVSGTWYNTVDANGNYEGPDMIQLHNGKGSFAITFNNANPGRPRPFSAGHQYYSQTQEVSDGSGQYARATEKGPINLITSTKDASQVTLGLYTPNH